MLGMQLVMQEEEDEDGSPCHHQRRVVCRCRRECRSTRGMYCRRSLFVLMNVELACKRCGV